MTPKIALLSSDTAHHRYFINMMKKDNLPLEIVIFEEKRHIPDFKVSPFHEEEEEKFEEIEFNKIININKINSENFSIKDVNDKKILEILEQKKINYGIVFGTGIIKKGLIDYFQGNLINIHRGIAEEYRGLDSDLWAIYHEDFKNIGVTIHKVDPELDTGDISYCKPLKLNSDMTIFQLRFYTTLLAYDLVKRTIVDFCSGNSQFIKQQKNGRYYSSMPVQLKKGLDIKFLKHVQQIQ
tara:strand:- start:2075 stop:2791 length:717 start_codon:yes stop_codon:yes gene_type:complete